VELKAPVRRNGQPRRRRREKLDDVVFLLFPQGGGFPRSNADNT
jgi:hypothetical protein